MFSIKGSYALFRMVKVKTEHNLCILGAKHKFSFKENNY